MLFTKNLIFHIFKDLISVNYINIYNRLLLFKKLLFLILTEEIRIIEVLIVIIHPIKIPLI